MSRDLMSITQEELLDGVEVGGVATYLGDEPAILATSQVFKI